MYDSDFMSMFKRKFVSFYKASKYLPKSLHALFPSFFIALCLLVFLAGAFLTKRAIAKTNMQTKSIGSWNIEINPKTELALTATLSGRPYLVLYEPSGLLTLFLSADYKAVSLKDVEKIIQDWGGDKKSLRIFKSKKGSVFSFQAKGRLHWFSTKGAYLIADFEKAPTGKTLRAIAEFNKLPKEKARKAQKRVKRRFL